MTKKFCDTFEWFDDPDLECSHGMASGSKCKLVSCTRRFVSTTLTCECDNTGCNWFSDTSGNSKIMNEKGPKCIRQIKKGIMEQSCAKASFHFETLSSRFWLAVNSEHQNENYSKEPWHESEDIYCNDETYQEGTQEGSKRKPEIHWTSCTVHDGPSRFGGED